MVFQLQPTPRDSSPTTTDPLPRESISSRFSVIFESILSRFRIATRKRPKNDSKSTPWERGRWWWGMNPLRVLPPTFILSKNSCGLDAKSRQKSANLGKNRLKIGQKSTQIRPKSTRSQLKSTKWGLFISHLRWWERTPKIPRGDGL